jgi:hypothetical protein
MSYGDSLLARGETIVYRGRQHPLAPISDAVRPAAIFLAGLVLEFVAGAISVLETPIRLLGLVGILVGLAWMGIIYFTWRAQEYLITSRRVLKVEGLLDKKSGDSSLDKINDAVLSQGLLARILHYGNLDILTAAEEAIDRYEMLNHAVDFKKAMLNAKNALEDGHLSTGGPGGEWTPRGGGRPAPAPADEDVAAKLDRLADLRDKGKITQADYDKKKAELLDRL